MCVCTCLFMGVGWLSPCGCPEQCCTLTGRCLFEPVSVLGVFAQGGLAESCGNTTLGSLETRHPALHSSRQSVVPSAVYEGPRFFGPSPVRVFLPIC